MNNHQAVIGDRSKKIRTYNFPQNRVTDHRIGLSVPLKLTMDGRLVPLIEALSAADKDIKSLDS